MIDFLNETEQKMVRKYIANSALEGIILTEDEAVKKFWTLFHMMDRLLVHKEILKF
jgi:hypothetical protein